MDNDKPYNLNGYYINFGSTGVQAVDKILSAVARAGKAYHHTESWGEKLDPYDERFTGECCEDWIQNAANELADQLAAAQAEIERLKAPWISVADRLPDHKNRVVLIVANRPEIAIWDGAYWRSEDGSYWGSTKATHWMEIPEHPKG